jgi:hypothetical protein
VFGPEIPLTFLILGGLAVGFVVGALNGLWVCLALRVKLRVREVALDGVFGGLGFLSGFFLILLIPWRNTASYDAGTTVVTSTMNHYQYPVIVAYFAAMLVPMIREVQRFRASRRS